VLRVFVYLGGGPEHVEVKSAPAGQSLAGLKEGRKAHFWWTSDEVDKDPGVAGVLRSLVPNLDRVWVGRDFGNGAGMQAVFDGTVVETGYDPSMVSLTALEPRRELPYPPIPPAGGVREPLRPAPAGPGPEATPPPGAPTGHSDGQGMRTGLFTQPLQAVAPVPLGQPSG